MTTYHRQKSYYERNKNRLPLKKATLEIVEQALGLLANGTAPMTISKLLNLQPHVVWFLRKTPDYLERKCAKHSAKAAMLEKRNGTALVMNADTPPLLLKAFVIEIITSGLDDLNEAVKRGYFAISSQGCYDMTDAELYRSFYTKGMYELTEYTGLHISDTLLKATERRALELLDQIK